MTPPGAKPLLAGAGLVRRYAGRTVVDVQRVEVGRGETLAVLGPNGAGKSTLIRLLMLLERPDAGHVRLAGDVVPAGDRRAMLRMAGVLQPPFLFAGTVTHNVGYGLGARRVPRPARGPRVRAALELLGLLPFADADVRTLSAGEAQRVGLARALVVGPELLFLDEPAANLDVGARRSLRRDLERIARSAERATVLVTHDPADALALADRIAVMEAGRLTQVAPPAELVRSPATPFVAAMMGMELLEGGVVEEVEAGAARAARRVAVRLPGGALLRARAAGPLATGEAAVLAYRPEDVGVELPATGSGLPSALSGGAPPSALRLRLGRARPTAGGTRVDLEGAPALAALLPRSSELPLEPGTEVLARLDASAVTAFRA